MADLLGKTFLVTGSTDGIGLHTAHRLTGQGAQVLVHGRSASRVQKAVESIKNKTGNQQVTGFVADLASLDAVKQLAEEIRQQQPALHVLINNAGVYEPQRQTSTDGYEMTWAVNVLAPFLLTSLLLDRVTERIVNVSSISAAGHLEFDNLQQERGYSAHNSYSLSKLCNQMFTYELARRLKAAGSVTANCLDPGTVNTKMLYAGWGPCGIDLKDANDELFVATSPSLAGVSGTYFVGGRQRRSPEVSYDRAAQQRLWELWEQQTGATWGI